MPPRQQRQTMPVQRQPRQGPRHLKPAERKRRHQPKHGTNPPETTVAVRQTPAKPQGPVRPQGPAKPQPKSRPVRDYLPTTAGDTAGNSVTLLEAEYIGCIVLIFLTVFTDGSSSYSSKMLAVMKRGTLATVLFFILALTSASGPNAAKVARALGALVIAGIFLGTAGQGTISALDAFFAADWTANVSSSSESSGDATAGQNISPAQAGNDLTQIANNAGLPSITSVSGIPQGIKDVTGFLSNFGNGVIGKLKGAL